MPRDNYVKRILELLEKYEDYKPDKKADLLFDEDKFEEKEKFK